MSVHTSCCLGVRVALGSGRVWDASQAAAGIFPKTDCVCHVE